MPMWVWIAIAVGFWFGLPVLLAFALARVLATIGREISEVHEIVSATFPTAEAPEETVQAKRHRAAGRRVTQMVSRTVSRNAEIRDA
jgi:hypothetical protein